MICEKCKQEIADNLKFCNKCGAKVTVKSFVESQGMQPNQDNTDTTLLNMVEKKESTSTKKCVCCGKELDVVAAFCDKCGAKQTTTEAAAPQANVRVGAKKRVTAGLLGIFLGGFGVHNFYLGFHVKAIIQILLSVFCCGVGGIWGLIEGIMILVNKINVDAKGESLQ